MRVNGIVCRVQAQVDGTKYDVGPIKASEAEKITAWTGYSIKEWEGNVADGDPLAAQALVALFRFRAGEHVRFDDIEIDDIDSIEGDLVDPAGRTLSVQMDEGTGKPVIRKGQPVWLFDGEPLDPQEPSPTD